MTMLSMVLAGMQLAVSQPAPAQPVPQSIPMLAQALDRCMTTYAVRMSRSDATDDAIFSAAVEGCRSLEMTLFETVRRDIPADQAERAIQQWTTQSRPNFMTLLQRIRSDRAARRDQ